MGIGEGPDGEAGQGQPLIFKKAETGGSEKVRHPAAEAGGLDVMIAVKSPLAQGRLESSQSLGDQVAKSLIPKGGGLLYQIPSKDDDVGIPVLYGLHLTGQFPPPCRPSHMQVGEEEEGLAPEGVLRVQGDGVAPCPDPEGFQEEAVEEEDSRRARQGEKNDQPQIHEHKTTRAGQARARSFVRIEKPGSGTRAVSNRGWMDVRWLMIFYPSRANFRMKAAARMYMSGLIFLNLPAIRLIRT